MPSPARRTPKSTLLALAGGEGLHGFMTDKAAWHMAVEQLKAEITERIATLDRREYKALILLRSEMLFASAIKDNDRASAIAALGVMAKVTGCYQQ